MPQRPARRRRPPARAFTLIEAAVSTVIVAVMASAAISLFAGAAGARVNQAEQRDADLLAADLLAEIVQGRYAEPGGNTTALGPDAGEVRGSADRTALDDVDDYDSFTERPPADRLGVPLPGFDGWTREARVAWVVADDLGRSLGADQGVKSITVTVTAPSGLTRKLTAYRSRWGVFDQRPSRSTGHKEISRVELRLRVGSMTTPIVTSVPIANLAGD